MSNSNELIPKKRLRMADDLYLIGKIEGDILGAKLPSNRQVLSFYFYNTKVLNLSKIKSEDVVAEKVASFYDKARIPTALPHNNRLKVEKLVGEYSNLKKNCGRKCGTQTSKERLFVEKLDDLFEMAHHDAMNMIQEQGIRDFLVAQRQKGRIGCFLGIERKEEENMREESEFDTEQKKRKEERQAQEEKMRLKAANESIIMNGIFE